MPKRALTPAHGALPEGSAAGFEAQIRRKIEVDNREST